MNWNDLKYIIALEVCGSLTNAATWLNTNATTVSRHIKRASEDYGHDLFVRKKNGEWTLTAHGQQVAKVAGVCKAAIDGLDEENIDSTLTDFKLSTADFVASSILAPRINDLIENQRKVQLTISSSDRNVSLAFGEADLAIRLGRPKSGKLVVSKIADLPMGIYSVGGRTTSEWVGLPSNLDSVPEMQLGLAFFDLPPVIRMGSFSCIRRVALERGIACIGPVNMLDGWNSFKRIDEGPFTSREVWSAYHESKRSDPLLPIVRSWVKDCFQLIASKSTV